MNESTAVNGDRSAGAIYCADIRSGRRGDGSIVNDQGAAVLDSMVSTGVIDGSAVEHGCSAVVDWYILI